LYNPNWNKITFVYFLSGESPCTLNCRPLGQQFYASLGLVADGTACTKPGYRAICVQGECKVSCKMYALLRQIKVEINHLKINWIQRILHAQTIWGFIWNIIGGVYFWFKLETVGAVSWHD
jgi:hypothetical protein